MTRASNNVTPKQSATYKPSKLFQKKASAMVSKENLSTSLVEQPRTSNPKIALHKFKTSAPQQPSQEMSTEEKARPDKDLAPRAKLSKSVLMDHSQEKIARTANSTNTSCLNAQMAAD